MQLFAEIDSICSSLVLAGQKELKNILDSGELVGDDMVVDVVKDTVEQIRPGSLPECRCEGRA